MLNNKALELRFSLPVRKNIALDASNYHVNTLDSTALEIKKTEYKSSTRILLHLSPSIQLQPYEVVQVTVLKMESQEGKKFKYPREAFHVAAGRAPSVSIKTQEVIKTDSGTIQLQTCDYSKHAFLIEADQNITSKFDLETAIKKGKGISAARKTHDLFIVPVKNLAPGRHQAYSMSETGWISNPSGNILQVLARQKEKREKLKHKK
jgi:hypothetical protein